MVLNNWLVGYIPPKHFNSNCQYDYKCITFHATYSTCLKNTANVLMCCQEVNLYITGQLTWQMEHQTLETECVLEKYLTYMEAWQSRCTVNIFSVKEWHLLTVFWFNNIITGNNRDNDVICKPPLTATTLNEE
jgi:hypothetical protein